MLLQRAAGGVPLRGRQLPHLLLAAAQSAAARTARPERSAGHTAALFLGLALLLTPSLALQLAAHPQLQAPLQRQRRQQQQQQGQ